MTLPASDRLRFAHVENSPMKSLRGIGIDPPLARLIGKVAPSSTLNSVIIVEVRNLAMHLVVLCAGYGTRLARDIEADPAHAHLSGIPKPLLPVAGKPLLSHWTDEAADSKAPPAFDKICVVVNSANVSKFESWRAKLGYDVALVLEESTRNEDRSGAVACIGLACDALADGNPVLVVAGDTLLKPDFSLDSFVRRYEELNQSLVEPDSGYQRQVTPRSLILACPCPEEDVGKRGIIEVDPKDGDKVTSFLEKPAPSETTSRLQSPCLYLLHRAHQRLLARFLSDRREAPLAHRDATGHFVKYLVENAEVHAFRTSGRYDVGGLESYLECCKEFKCKNAKIPKQPVI